METIYVIIAGAIGFGLKYLIDRFPKTVSNVNATLGEAGELFQAIAEAVAGGAVDPDDLKRIVSEAKDVVDIWKGVEKAGE